MSPRYIALSVAVASVALTLAAPAHAAVTHGELLVTQLDAGNNSISSDTPSISVELVNRSGGPTTLLGGNRADYDLYFGDGSTSDWNTGVMITTVSQNTRNNDTAGSTSGTQNTTSAISGRPTNNYYTVATFATGTTSGIGGEEFNVNVAYAYFPYSKYLGGVAINSSATNGGANDTLYASPGITLGTHVIDLGGGQTTIDLRSFGATSSNGILLVNHAKNEDNFALSQPNADGTFTVIVKDNGSDAGSYEQDPMAFVFVSVDDTDVTAMGRLTYGLSAQVTKGDYTVSFLSNGRYLLTIPGQNNDSGTLIVSPEGGETYNRDNIVNYEWDATLNGWVIESRDLPNASLQGDANATWSNQRAFSFAFFAGSPIPEPAALTLLPLLTPVLGRRRQ